MLFDLRLELLAFYWEFVIFDLGLLDLISNRVLILI